MDASSLPVVDNASVPLLKMQLKMVVKRSCYRTDGHRIAWRDVARLAPIELFHRRADQSP
jgi:hypothetical protein